MGAAKSRALEEMAGEVLLEEVAEDPGVVPKVEEVAIDSAA